MNKNLGVLLILAVCITSCDSRVVDVKTMKDSLMNVYDHECNDVHGVPVDRNMFAGKVTLVVNLASKCGYTPQYKDLQTLHERYKSQGFSVVGFPCNDFGGQEPGDAAEITACALQYGAEFPIMEKVGVIESDSQSEIYRDLKEATGVLPNWNFGKYLIDKNGTPVTFFGTNVEPLSPDLTGRIETLLSTTQ